MRRSRNVTQANCDGTRREAITLFSFLTFLTLRAGRVQQRVTVDVRSPTTRRTSGIAPRPRPVSTGLKAFRAPAHSRTRPRDWLRSGTAPFRLENLSMCAACGVPTHVAVLDGEPPPGQPPARVPGAGPAKFAALRNPSCRLYLGGAALAMMADNIEHVITYWVIWLLASMIILAGLGSFFVGAAMQSVMPAIASDMGSANGTAYGVLLFANGLGGVLGGLLLEGTGWVKLSVRTAHCGPPSSTARHPPSSRSATTTSSPRRCWSSAASPTSPRCRSPRPSSSSARHAKSAARSSASTASAPTECASAAASPWVSSARSSACVPPSAGRRPRCASASPSWASTWRSPPAVHPGAPVLPKTAARPRYPRK
jgi:hypothetical protein